MRNFYRTYASTVGSICAREHRGTARVANGLTKAALTCDFSRHIYRHSLEWKLEFQHLTAGGWWADATGEHNIQFNILTYKRLKPLLVC